MSTLDREELFISIYDFMTSTNCFVVILKPIVHTEDINAIKVRKDLFKKAFMDDQFETVVQLYSSTPFIQNKIFEKPLNHSSRGLDRKKVLQIFLENCIQSNDVI